MSAMRVVPDARQPSALIHNCYTPEGPEVGPLSPAQPATRNPPCPRVNFRVSSERLAFIDRAAAIRGVSRTEFVLRSSEAAAIEILNERPVIALDDEAWDDFIAALDAPVEIDPAVKARYARRPQWDR